MRVCPKCGKVGKNGASGMKFHIDGCGHDPIARFWSFVEKGDGCWLWTGAKHRDGYGRANVVLEGKLKIRIAHRMAWVFTYGPIPGDRDVCHSCDARLCCRPAHLWLGTHKQNMDDMARKGRSGSRGERCVHAKLTVEKVRELRRLRDEGWKFSALAERYGILGSTACSIYSRRLWKHVV